MPNVIVNNAYGNSRMLEIPGEADNAVARKEVASENLADVDTYLLANGYTAAKLKKLTVNDKIYALRVSRGIAR